MHMYLRLTAQALGAPSVVACEVPPEVPSLGYSTPARPHRTAVEAARDSHASFLRSLARRAQSTPTVTRHTPSWLGVVVVGRCRPHTTHLVPFRVPDVAAFFGPIFSNLTYPPALLCIRLSPNGDPSL